MDRPTLIKVLRNEVASGRNEDFESLFTQAADGLVESGRVHFALDMLIAAGWVTRAKVDEAIDLAARFMPEAGG